MSDSNTIAAALLVVRSILGFVFVLHGAKHFINREKTIAWTESIGFRSPSIQWFFMTFAELGIGIGLVAGLLTSFAASGLVAMMFVAFWTVHRHAGFFVSARPDEGYEYALVLATAAVAIAMLGPGEWSVDEALDLTSSFDGLTGAAIALGGVGLAALQLAIFHRPGQLRRGSSG